MLGGAAALPEGLRLVTAGRLRVTPGLHQRQTGRPLPHRHPQTEAARHRITAVTGESIQALPTSPGRTLLPVAMVTTRIAAESTIDSCNHGNSQDPPEFVHEHHCERVFNVRRLIVNSVHRSVS